MQLAGPFFVKGTAIRSGLGVNAGDTVVAMTAGEISITVPGWPYARDFDVFGGDNLLGVVNSLPVPTLPVGSLVATISTQNHGFKRDLTFSALASGEVVLDVNAPPNTVFGKGWSVYLVRVEPTEGRPRMPFWEKFRDFGVVVDLSVVDPGAARLIRSFRILDAVFFEGEVHLFWKTVDKQIGHLAFDPFPPAFNPFPTRQPTAGERIDVLSWFPHGQDFTEISAAVFDGQLHVLVASNVGLRHVMGTTGNWTVKTVDPSQCWWCCAEAVGADELHVVFSDIEKFNLRHGLFSQVTVTGDISATGLAWQVSTIDGERPPSSGLFKVKGAIPASVGFGCTLVVDAAKQLHVFYNSGLLKVPRTGGYDLRQAVLGVPGDPARQWELETIDGAGHTIRAAQGQNSDWSGFGVGARQLADGSLHVFYLQVSAGGSNYEQEWDNLRWAHQSVTWITGENWRPFETIDGLSKLAVANPPQRFGKTRGYISICRTNVLEADGRLDVVYAEKFDGQYRLRHAFKVGDLPWMFQLVDGHSLDDDRVERSVSYPVAVPFGGAGGGVAVLYVDLTTGTIRHARLSM